MEREGGSFGIKADGRACRRSGRIAVRESSWQAGACMVSEISRCFMHFKALTMKTHAAWALPMTSARTAFNQETVRASDLVQGAPFVPGDELIEAPCRALDGNRLRAEAVGRRGRDSARNALQPILIQGATAGMCIGHSSQLSSGARSIQHATARRRWNFA